MMEADPVSVIMLFFAILTKTQTIKNVQLCVSLTEC